MQCMFLICTIVTEKGNIPYFFGVVIFLGRGISTMEARAAESALIALPPSCLHIYQQLKVARIIQGSK